MVKEISRTFMRILKEMGVPSWTEIFGPQSYNMEWQLDGLVMAMAGGGYTQHLLRGSLRFSIIEPLRLALHGLALRVE